MIARAALLLFATVGVAGAQPALDPLKSPECGQALALLQAARAGPAGQVEGLRRQAATTCLGMGDAGPRPGRVLQSPIGVPPPVVEAPRPPPPLVAAPAPLPAPLEIPRPSTVTSCDAGGCWSNDGTRLQHVPHTVIVPLGPCIMQGTFVHCP